MAASELDSWDAVFFDIGGVVVSLPSIRQGYADYVAEFAAERGLDPAETLEEWRETLGDHFRSAEGTEYVTAREGYRKAFAAVVDGDLREEEWRPGFEAATAEAMEPEPHAPETVRALADSGLHVGVVSDIDTWEAQRMLDRFGIADSVASVTTSEAVGRKKPDAAMFETAIEAAGVAPGRSLMVGDRYEHDMVGATRVGLQTVAYDGTAAEAVADAEREGHRVLDDDAVDYAVEDLRDLLALVGLED
ncbi:MAG: HAD family hydrolase [Halorientalis sp.]